MNSGNAFQSTSQLPLSITTELATAQVQERKIRGCGCYHRGPTLHSASPHFACLTFQANNLVTMSEDVALASSATDSASLAPENVTLDPTNATVVTTGQLEGYWTIDYTCTQVPPRHTGAVDAHRHIPYA